MIYKIGTRRPMVMEIQALLNLNANGIFGHKTEDAVKDFQQSKGLKVDGIVGRKTLKAILDKSIYNMDFRIAEIVATFETGNTSNAFGFTSVVPNDGAGMNYGFMQQNRYGSLQTMKRKYGRPSVEHDALKKWYGSAEGIEAQMEYFKNEILAVVDMTETFGEKDPLFRALMTDAMIQGGNVYPSRQIKSWNHDWKLSPMLKDLFIKIYSDTSLSIRERFIKCVTLLKSDDPQTTIALRRSVYAELHPRSGRVRFLDAQLSRRRAVAYGKGVVYGGKVDIGKQFGIY